jgi:hypothetical protein
VGGRGEMGGGCIPGVGGRGTWRRGGERGEDRVQRNARGDGGGNAEGRTWGGVGGTTRIGSGYGMSWDMYILYTSPRSLPGAGWSDSPWRATAVVGREARRGFPA